MKNQIQRLVDNFASYISVPWRHDIASYQRVVFCIYSPKDELIIRAQLGEFEIRTKKSGHRWYSLDLTDCFANWMSREKYAESIFKNPSNLSEEDSYFQKYLLKQFSYICSTNSVDENTVVCVYGIASLFGLASVNETVQAFASLFSGKLVVLFPGSYENNVYKVLDAYDGWNYLAVPISSDKSY